MEKMDESLHKIEVGLQRFPAVALQEFRQATPEVRRRLSLVDLYLWGKEGIALAECSFRSWEAAAEYFRATPEVLRLLEFSQFIPWSQWGRGLAQESPALSCAYFRASAPALHWLPSHLLGHWADLGRSLYKGTWRSSSLACRFFEVSPQVLRQASLPELESLVRLLDRLAPRSPDLALACLNLAPDILAELEKEDRQPLLDLAYRLAEASPRDAKACFEVAPRSLSRVRREERPHFLDMAASLAGTRPGDSLSLFTEGSRALGSLDWVIHPHLLDLCQKLLASSPQAALAFLRSSPAVLARLRLQDLEPWFQEGARLLAESEEAGASYFRLESGRAAEVLEGLSCGVELGMVSEVLRMYSRALTGRNTLLLAAQELAEKNLGWASPDKPATEGSAIYLPALVKKYPHKGENFAWCKVAVTHQAVHMEFGSFDFCFHRPACLFPDRRLEVEQALGLAPEPITHFQRFYNLFPDRKLASDIFTVVEDTRVDHRAKQEYKGIRPAYQRIQRDSLESRPDVITLPLREAILENLIRISLGQTHGLMVPGWARPAMERAARIQARVQQAAAGVEDSAEATLLLYRLLNELPNVALPPQEWQSWDLPQDPEEAPASELGEGGGAEMAHIPAGEGGQDYSGPQEVEFRGEFKPELVQMLQRLEAQGDSQAVSSQALKEALAESAEVAQASPGEATSPGQLAANLVKEAARRQRPPSQGRRGQRETPHLDPLERDEPLCFLYDEWDFRAGDYKPRWCRVRQRPLEEGSADLFEKTLQSYYRLSTQIKKQFELITPELFRKLKRLPDGEEYELDAVIEAVVERRAGQSPSEKLYWRRNKMERDVAVAFLLDMSASTAEAVDDVEGVLARRWDQRGDPPPYVPWTRASGWQDRLQGNYKRIIDVERESTVLLIGALETIGDTYGIYGFSGYGRENVEFFIIKDMEEPFSERVKRRIDKISPMQATRMGPAIRHATAKLEAQASKTRILFLISDGRPQDHGYSRDGVEKEYAIHDTKMALLEAKRKDIIPFCLTVDRAGHDYLKVMCSDMGYEVVDDIHSLPKRLPALYRRLTI